MEDDFIGIRNLDTGIGSAGVGFVVVPSDVEREQYINDCYRTNTLTIYGGRGYGFFTGVHADINVMQNIHFPTDEENSGTPVIWVKDAISQLPVIVGSLRRQDDYYSLNENQYSLKRGFEKKNVEIFIDGNTSGLDITILGDKDNPSNLDIKLSSENSDSVLNVTSDNEINVVGNKSVNVITNETVTVRVTENGKDRLACSLTSEKVEMKFSENDNEKTSITYEAGTGLNYKDEFDNEIVAKDGEIDIISDKINHNNGKEPMVLGDTLKGILDDILSAIQKLTVVSPVGTTSVPVNVAEFASIQAKLDNIKSKKSNLD